MTPISAIASLPIITGPDQEPHGDRAARRATPGLDVTPAISDESPTERSFWDRLWGKEGFSFGAVLDIINPLQHIPIVSTIYRAATGDTIGPGPRMIGGTLFGGVVGLFAATADVAVEGITGKDTGSHVMAMLPEPDPVAQWDHGEGGSKRGSMIAMTTFSGGASSQFAAAQTGAKPNDIESIAAATVEVDIAARQPAPASPQTMAALVPEPTETPPPNRLFTPKPRSAQLGAGGALVPMAVNGRPSANLPSAKELAANPALLQEMRQGGASAINSGQKPNGRIDTAIKGRSFIAPAGASESAQNQTNGLTAWHDRMAQKSQTIPVDGEVTTKTNVPAIPEVGPDFFLKMQQALDKYQALRPAPTVDVTH